MRSGIKIAREGGDEGADVERASGGGRKAADVSAQEFMGIADELMDYDTVRRSIVIPIIFA
jgi:hypothetical protein